MNVFDQAARYAAKLDPRGFLAWLLSDIWAEVEFVGWLDTRTLQFPGEKDRTCDTVAHLRETASTVGGGEPSDWAVPIEFQSEPETNMLERLLEYAVRVRAELRPDGGRSRRYEVAGALLNLTGRRRARSWKTGLPKPSRAALTWTVELRTMAQEDAAGLLADIEAGRHARCLLPWIPLMKGADQQELTDVWKRIAATEPDSRRRSDYGALALIFAELAKRSAVWKQALKGWNMKESQQVLEWQEEARQEGREQATRAKLLETLNLRFQETPDDLRAQIEMQTDLATLDRWFRLAVTSADLESFQKAL